jgi:hypothetical protein
MIIIRSGDKELSERNLGILAVRRGYTFALMIRFQ